MISDFQYLSLYIAYLVILIPFSVTKLNGIYNRKKTN
jgi:hypothetical protein